MSGMGQRVRGDKFIVRLPDGMRDRIAEAAKANNRSMNSEIVARLLASFDGPPVSPAQVDRALDDILAMLQAKLDSMPR